MVKIITGMTMQHIKGLNEIAENYEVFLIDLHGVMYESDTIFSAANLCVQHLTKLNKRIIFVSNMPRSHDVARKHLQEKGLGSDAYDIITSGDVVRAQLTHPTDVVFQSLGKKLYHFGQERNSDLLSGIDAEIVGSIQDADYILLSKFIDDIQEMPAIIDLLSQMKALYLPMVCANPDLSVPLHTRNRFTAGFIGNMYEEMGGVVHYYGKPHGNIFQAVFAKYPLPKQQFLMIGDTIATDIQGAHNSGIDSLLVLTGNSAHFLQINSAVWMTQQTTQLPTYFANQLEW